MRTRTSRRQATQKRLICAFGHGESAFGSKRILGRSVSTSADFEDPPDSPRVVRHRCVPKRSPPLGHEPFGSPNGCQFGCLGALPATLPLLSRSVPFSPASALGPARTLSSELLLGCKRSKITFEDHNMHLTCGNVELRGLEPLVSCMPCKSGNSPIRSSVTLICELSAPVCL